MRDNVIELKFDKIADDKIFICCNASKLSIINTPKNNINFSH